MEQTEDRKGAVSRQSSNRSTRSSSGRLGLLNQSRSLLNPRQGLLTQTQELFHDIVTDNPENSTTMGSGQSISKPSASSVNVRDVPDSSSKQERKEGEKNARLQDGNQCSTSSASNISSGSTEVVRDLRQTLCDHKLVLEFRIFLRTKIDRNKSDNPDHKKMCEQWLDFVTICEQVFELPEDESENKIKLMVDIGCKFFAKPPEGYNMAVSNQLNRKELINHCKNLLDGVSKDPDISLLRDSYEFIYSRLDQKHDLFSKTYKPPTRLAALLCTLL